MVELDRHDPMPGLDQRSGDRTGPRADVEDECAVGQGCLTDEASSRSVVELVPAPPWRRASHGGEAS